jgi:hypothetical protein
MGGNKDCRHGNEGIRLSCGALAQWRRDGGSRVLRRWSSTHAAVSDDIDQLMVRCRESAHVEI